MYFNIFFSILFFITFITTTLYYNPLKKENENIITLSGKIMGTYWQVKIPKINNTKHIHKLIKKYLHQDENMLSSWKKKSLVSQFNTKKKHQLQVINKDFFRIISMALKINKKTSGKLDITIGSLINIWGFGDKDKPIRWPSKKEIEKNIVFSGSEHLKLIHNLHGLYLEKDINGLEINLSTLGEGFAVDHLSYILRKQGIKNYTIAIGGAVLVKLNKTEEKPKIIAIQKPTDQGKAIHRLICLKNNAISTAGSYRNYYYLNKRKISHLIDPDTGVPTRNNLVSVSVIANTALEADGWDTGLLILGFKKAKKLALKEKLSVCLITQEKNILSTWMSPSFKKFLIK